MNDKPVNTMLSGEHLTLPEPDPDNITVLTRNLPNKPILPWSHYDSPWQEAEDEKTEQDADTLQDETLDQSAENSEESERVEAIVDEANELDEQPSLVQLEQSEETEQEQIEETPTDELTG